MCEVRVPAVLRAVLWEVSESSAGFRVSYIQCDVSRSRAPVRRILHPPSATPQQDTNNNLRAQNRQEAEARTEKELLCVLFAILQGSTSIDNFHMEHAWQSAAIATGLISSVPTLILPFIPESATKPGSALQRVLLCFAVGGMMGDVFLHLLPHLLMGECVGAIEQDV